MPGRFHLKSTATWRWWHWVAGLLWTATSVLVIGAVVTRFIDAVAMFSSGAVPPERAEWPLYVLGVLAVITILWQHIIVPLLSSAAATFTEHRTPRYVLRAYTLSTFMPAIVTTIIVATNFLPVYFGRRSLDQWWSAQPWLQAAVWAPPAFVIIAVLVQPVIQRRVVRSAAREQRCMTCGYDLLGNVSRTCPECGRGLAPA